MKLESRHFSDVEVQGNIIEFNITAHDRAIVPKIIENIQIYNLKVKTI